MSPGGPSAAASPLITSPAAGALTVVLVGNPNTGKTTLFNTLSGLRQRVGNYPGVTVESKKGQMTCCGRSFDLIDLPGTYSLAPRSPDEMLAVDVLLGRQAGEHRPDVVVAIVDASNLERNLYLTTQVLDLGVPVVVALNMIDIAQRHGVTIDAERLGRQLGVPVVPIQANKGRGLDELRQAISATAGGAAPARTAPFPEAFERETADLQEAVGPEVPAFLVRRLLLDVGGFTEQRLADWHGLNVQALVQAARQRLAAGGCTVPAVEARSRYAWIREAVAGCIRRPAQRPVTWTDRLDRVLTHRLWGSLLFLLVMAVVFQAIFTWARPLMKLIGDGKDFLAATLRDTLPPGPFTSLLTDGVIEGVGSVVIFLPQILILFAFMAILEDCGYMARAAFLMDRVMSRCGLSGKSFIPMLSSVACAVPGIMATRVIEDRRDRLTTILVAPLMSCSARLPVYILLIGAFLSAGPAWLPGLVMFALYGLGMIAAPLVALTLKRTLLRGQVPVFVMEMPPYKWPSLRLILRRMIDSGWAFVRRAGTLILASMILVWALLYFPSSHPEGGTYPARIAQQMEQTREQRQHLEELENRMRAERQQLASQGDNPAAQERIAQLQEQMKPLREAIAPINALQVQWTRRSFLGRLGQALEPVVRPLGWDWRIGVAALASFPAREVVVGTLGIVFQVGKADTEAIRDEDNPADTDLGQALQAAHWENKPEHKLFTVPTALSVMVFFALCCQCASTLAVIRRETRSWRWPLFTFVYMTILAYIAALVVYQIGRLVA
jgi:ferrous iron transport protein B